MPESNPVTPAEAAPVIGQRDPTNIQPQPSAALPIPPALATAIPAPVDNTPPAAHVSVPSVADDTDLIEKEWVSKAKEIVERTRENPYVQSKELNLFKADYMKKRYNKTLKLSE
jgi:hypothetical protein